MQDDIYVGPPYFFLDPAVAPPTFLILEPPLFLFQNFWIRDRIWGRYFQIWESDSCSDSGCSHRSNRNLPMFL